MSTNEHSRRDAGRCPRCGAMGVLPPVQPVVKMARPKPCDALSALRGRVRDHGMTWVGAIRPPVVGPDGLTDEQIDVMAKEMVDALLEGCEAASHPRDDV
jgi:hypothetical protein